MQYHFLHQGRNLCQNPFSHCGPRFKYRRYRCPFFTRCTFFTRPDDMSLGPISSTLWLLAIKYFPLLIYCFLAAPATGVEYGLHSQQPSHFPARFPSPDWINSHFAHCVPDLPHHLCKRTNQTPRFGSAGGRGWSGGWGWGLRCPDLITPAHGQ